MDTPMTLEQLHAQGYGDYHDLKPHLKQMVNLGRNDFDLENKYAVLTDDSQWDYMPEDRIYELRAYCHHQIPQVTNY